jgi:hypothetical protein
VIGVIADHRKRTLVEEFFELFKTPWEFARAGTRYDAALVTADTGGDIDAPVVLIYGSERNCIDGRIGVRLGQERTGALVKWRGKPLPIYRKAASVESPGLALAAFEGAGEAACAKIGAPGRTVFRFGFDLLEEVEYLLRSGQPVLHAPVPTLDHHIGLFRDCILSAGVPLVEIPPCPPGCRFVACLTHDVDFAGIGRHRLDATMFGFVYRAVFGSLARLARGSLSWKKALENWKAVASLPGIYLGIQKDFMLQFDRYAELEQGLPSTYFLVPCKNTPGLDHDGRPAVGRAVKYDIGDIPEEVSKLSARGAEIGLHGIDAWRDERRAAEERSRILGISKKRDIGVRMHWLFFSDDSPGVLERSGFSYDSTIGYNEAVGFRAGTSQVYRLPGTRLSELPLLAMDTALLSPGRMALSEDAAFERVRELCASVAASGGAFTVNWHHRSVGPERFWDDLYARLVMELKANGAWFTTARGAVAWFEKRRTAVFRDLDPRDGKLRIGLDASSGDGLPGVVLRVHDPSAGTTDLPVDGYLETEIDLKG